MSKTESDDPSVLTPDTARKEDIPPTAHFDIAAVYEEEQRRIFAFLKRQATSSVNVARPTLEQASHDFESALAVLSKFHESAEDRKDRRLYGEALRNQLEEKAPGRGSITAYLVVMVLALLFEITIGLLIWMFGQGSVQPVILAALLAGGGYMAGNGLAGILNRKIHFADWGIVPDGRAPVMDVVKLVGGALLVIGLSYGRAAGADDPQAVLMVVLISFGLAVTVAIFEGLYAHTKEKYRKIRDKMFDAQTWYARDKHQGSIDGYRKYFMNDVTRLLREADPAYAEHRDATAAASGAR